MEASLVAVGLLLLLHLAFILFAIFGGLLVLRHGWVAWLHLPALVWGIWIEASHGICPLTTIENALRWRAGFDAYSEGFIGHYLVPLIYPPGLQPAQQGVIAIAFALWSLAIYSLVLWRWWRRRGQGAAG